MKITLILTLIISCPAYSIVINELMVNPATNGEWIELYNPSLEPIDLVGWHLMDEADHLSLVSSGTILPNNYIVFAIDSVTQNQLHIPTDKQGTTQGQWCSLNNGGDRIQLTNRAGDQIDEVVYRAKAGAERGFSWERIEYATSGDVQSNWGRSVAIKGHTAGYQNSIKYTGVPLSLSLIAEPNPFNPSIGEKVRILYTTSSPEAHILVSIYDLHNRNICSLANNLLVGTDPQPLLWDGHDDQGASLPIGRYIIFAQAIDIRSGHTVEKIITIVLAGKLK